MGTDLYTRQFSASSSPCWPLGARCARPRGRGQQVGPGRDAGPHEHHAARKHKTRAPAAQRESQCSTCTMCVGRQRVLIWMASAQATSRLALFGCAWGSHGWKGAIGERVGTAPARTLVCATATPLLRSRSRVSRSGPASRSAAARTITS